MNATANNNEESTIGLCASCRHVKRVHSDREAVFYLCGLSAKDDRFPKYPRLPVQTCPGYEVDPEMQSPSGDQDS